MPAANCPKMGLDQDALSCSIRSHITHSVGKLCSEAGHRDVATALSLTLRDRLVDKMLETRDRYRDARAKRVYYLSIEYLLGRCLGNNLCNMRIDAVCRELMAQWGFNLAEIREDERDPALGNGGLGRLAACFLDSLATLDIPGYGYGIHYEFGLFKQTIENDRQVERPDYWLAEGMPPATGTPGPGRHRAHVRPDRKPSGSGRRLSFPCGSTGWTSWACPTTSPSWATATAPSIICACSPPVPPTTSTCTSSTRATTSRPSIKRSIPN